ncbi:MAG: hypothetical protein IKP51_10415 [Treponema sp.]|nr:hypothetical protein [Treponema sp.]
MIQGPPGTGKTQTISILLSLSPPHPRQLLVILCYIK